MTKGQKFIFLEVFLFPQKKKKYHQKKINKNFFFFLGSAKREYSDDLYVFYHEDRIFKKLEKKGEIPPKTFNPSLHFWNGT